MITVSNSKNRIEFELPYPPSINNYYGRYKNRTFLKKEVRDYRDTVLISLKNRLETFGDKKVIAEIDLYRPDRRRRDIDNVLKCVLDIGQLLGVYDDDSQVVTMLVSKKEIIKPGKVSVRIFLYEREYVYIRVTQKIFNIIRCVVYPYL